MFGIGYQEMFIILVVAMIIFGPSRLPELAGQVGRWVRDFRRMSSDLTGEFQQTFAEVEEVKKSFQRELSGIQDEIEGAGKGVRGDSKKIAAKSTTATKPATTATQSSKISTRSVGAKDDKATANGAKSKMPALEPRDKGARNGKHDGALLPLATKADPLSNVSALDLEFVGPRTGIVVVSIDTAASGDDEALARVRKRRAAAAYAKRASA